MAKKTNKTSHVLNLITNGAPAEPEGEPEHRPPAEGAELPPSEPEETPAAASSGRENPLPPRESSTKPAASGDKTVIVVNETSENDKISSEILNRLTDQLEEDEAGLNQDSYRMVNVMEQILQRQNLGRYMEQYGVCTCSRCRADVLALILTRLPAKYVVVDSSTVAPIIGFYESKFKIRILTEIIKSCMDVKEKPRHGRNGSMQYIKRQE